MNTKTISDVKRDVPAVQRRPEADPAGAGARKVRIAVVGLNFGVHIVRELVEGWPAGLFEVAGVCDLDHALAREVADQFGTGTYPSLEALLADPTVEVVGLFSAPVGRAELIRQIIRAGKDVMTTKPFEADPDAASAVLAEAEQLGRIVHLNSPPPVLSPDLQQVLDWQREFDLGRPVGCRLDTYASYQEAADGSWKDDPEKCPAAPVTRLGIYLINDVLSLLGEPEAVQVQQSRIRTGRPTADNAQLSIRFRNGALANIFCSFCISDGLHYRNAMTVNFERGTVYRNVGPLERASGTAEMSLVTTHGGHGKPHIERKLLQICSGHYQWDVLHRAVLDRATAPLTDAKMVVMGLKVLAAMGRAAHSGCEELV